MNPLLDHLYIFLMFIPILTVHEAAHAWAAHLLGDDTAEEEGRLTLNPVSHIDLWGTLIIPALNILVSSSVGLIGWGRPVPVNPGNLRRWRRDEILIALAGPAANFGLAFLCMIFRVFLVPAGSPWQKLFEIFAYVSVFLGTFNLLPVPPLDGWNIARNLFGLPREWAERGAIWWFLALLLIINIPPVMVGMSFLSEQTLAMMQLMLGAGHRVL